jgi:hypothetical protein
LDPAHIAPSRSDANSNGHFPLASGHVQAGTPRGFNLGNIPYFGGNGAMAGSFQSLPSASFPGFMGVNQPGSWAGNGGLVAGDPSVLHQPGVVRRGGGRFSGRSGPYDRRGGRHGSGGANMMNGRLSPVRGLSGVFGPGGRLPPNTTAAYMPPGHSAAGFISAGSFPDALGSAGGHQAMIPREAVQGRSLKSYEDLDAVGGAGGGELNY